MNEVNKTLYIPLYGKTKVSQQGIILNDPSAEEIWKEEAYPIHGKSRSKWLAYNMAMRARVFDDWTDTMLQRNKGALVLHIGCGLDSRYMRVKTHCSAWVDCDLPEVIEIRRKHFQAHWDYPGKWYAIVAIPSGYGSREALVDAIVRDTLTADGPSVQGSLKEIIR